MIQGVSVTIDCPIESKHGYEIQWSILGKTEIADDKVATTEDMTAVTVRELTVNDTGQYTCSASNNGGTNSATSDITVLGEYPNMYLKCLSGFF